MSYEEVDSMQFEGQKKLEKILQEAECSRSVHEIYFFLRGLLAGTHVAGPSAWFGWLFEDKEPVFDSQEQAQRLMGNVMGLWNLIASAKQGNTHLPDIREDFPATVEGIVNRVTIINQRNLAFMNGLDFAGTKSMEMTPDGRTAFEELSQYDAQCSGCLELAKKKVPAKKEELMETHEVLNQMEAIMEDCIQQVSVSLEEARKTAVPRPKAPQKSEKIPRNEPCPCGSGKKYKKCCWLKLH